MRRGARKRASWLCCTALHHSLGKDKKNEKEPKRDLRSHQNGKKEPRVCLVSLWDSDYPCARARVPEAGRAAPHTIQIHATIPVLREGGRGDKSQKNPPGYFPGRSRGAAPRADSPEQTHPGGPRARRSKFPPQETPTNKSGTDSKWWKCRRSFWRVTRFCLLELLQVTFAGGGGGGGGA